MLGIIESFRTLNGSDKLLDRETVLDRSQETRNVSTQISRKGYKSQETRNVSNEDRFYDCLIRAKTILADRKDNEHLLNSIDRYLNEIRN